MATKRERHDWDALFHEWFAEGRPDIRQFLSERDLDPKQPHNRQCVRGWKRRASRLKLRMDKNRQKTEAAVSSKPEVDPKEAAKVAKVPAEVVDTPAAPQPWQIIEDFRRNQALADYKDADKIRTALRVLLKTGLRMEEGEPRCDLTAAELHRLSHALINVQKVQRLALGLSTENVGVDIPTGEEGEEERKVPTFEVQIGSTGKFKSPRPRRVS